jgi:DNA-binding NarL/FixJ family response regulator
MVSNLTYDSTPRQSADEASQQGTMSPGAASESSSVTLVQSRLRIFIADPAPLVRAGLRHSIQDAPDLEIVGEAADGPTAVRLAIEQQPDVLILDLVLPGMNGLEVMRTVAEHVAGIRMLVLSQWRLEDDVRAAFSAGAAGYMLKDDDVSGMADILRGLQAGRLHVSTQVSDLVIRQYVIGAHHAARVPALTRRQAEILSLIARGRTSREVGTQLGITLRTVQTHRSHIMRRLQVHTEAGLVHAALQMGFLDRS